MKTIFKTTLALFLIAILGSCNNDYFDVNTPYDATKSEQLNIEDLLGPVIHSTIEGQRSAELTLGNYVQNFVNEGGGASSEAQLSSLWEKVYLQVLPNIKVIKQKSQETGAIHYNAIADILTAINLGIATDCWGNIPYTQASMGADNLYPKFDTQETIYNEIFKLLDSAIAKLNRTDNSGFSIKNDLIYKGETDKWVKAAYTLKARYQLRMLNKGLLNATDIINSINNGFTSNNDNFLMSYNDKINPWYSSEVLSKNTGNFHRDIASQLVSSMNGNYYPFSNPSLEIDPRLPKFATNEGATEWKGFVSGGEGKSPDGSNANTFFAQDGFYTSVNSPLILISYAEAMFIKAEAEFLANGGTSTSTGATSNAYNAYLEGINASMEMYKVDATDYVADASIAVGEANLMLNHIMKEKYIHNFLNPETFTDFRRYDFSDDVFKGLKIREENDSSVDYAGEWFLRASYPTSELNRNKEVVNANKKLPTEPVWWDE